MVAVLEGYRGDGEWVNHLKKCWEGKKSRGVHQTVGSGEGGFWERVVGAH